jgi:hypothetical protein
MGRQARESRCFPCRLLQCISLALILSGVKADRAGLRFSRTPSSRGLGLSARGRPPLRPAFHLAPAADPQGRAERKLPRPFPDPAIQKGLGSGEAEAPLLGLLELRGKKRRFWAPLFAFAGSFPVVRRPCGTP